MVDVSENNRIQVFDIAKGIGILFVVFAHLHLEQRILNFFYLFHMPFFFVLSGLFFKTKSYDNIENVLMFIKNKFRRLLVPYLLINIICLSLHNFLIKIHIYSTDTSLENIPNITTYYTSIKDYITNFFLHIEPIISPSWFLYVLFVSLTIYIILNYILRKIQVNFEFNKLTSILLFLLFGFYLSLHHSKLLYIGTICSVLSCLYIGEHIKKMDITSLCNFKYYCFSIVFLLFFTFYLKKPILISINQYYNPILLILLSIFGFIFVINFANNIKSEYLINILNYIGKRTLTILLFHLIGFKIITLLQILILNESFVNLAYLRGYKLDWYWVIAYIFVGVCFPLLLEYIYSNIKKYILFKNKDKLL